MARSRNKVLIPPVRFEFCENCGNVTDSKRTIIVMPTLAMKRLRCHCCKEKLEPKRSKRDGQVRILTVGDPGMPGLDVPTCKECAGYCVNCRYDWEEE